MDRPDALLHALSAIVLSVFALVVLMGRPRRSASVLLSAFLLLIAGNQGAEAFRSVATEAGEIVTWFRVASVFAALDPAVLFLFGSSQAGELWRRPSGPMTVVGVAPGVLLALFAGWFLLAPTDPATAIPFAFLLSVYTAAVYVTVFVWLARRAFRGPEHAGWDWLLPPIALVGLFSLPRVLEHLAVLLWGHHGQPQWLASALLAAILAVLVVSALVFGSWAYRQARTREDRVVIAWALYGSLAIVTLFQAYRFEPLLAAVDLSPGEDFLLMVGKAGSAIRWLFFGAFVSIAVLRHDALGLNVPARRRAARVLVGLTFASFFATLVAFGPAWLRDGIQDLPLLAFLLIAIALAVSQGMRALIDRVAARAYGVPMPTDVGARHELYKIAVATAMAAGRNPLRDRDLAALREELALDSREASVLERLADASVTGPLQPGQLVGQRYLIESVAGRGASGRIFVAADELLGRVVAIKEIFHDEDERDRMLSEARIAGAIEHANVLRVYDALARPGVTLLVAEHVAGGSLGERIRARGPLGLEEAFPIIEGILEGLAEVHRHGVIHRDLKPDNILLDQAGRPKIADFGIASRRTSQTIGYGRGPIGTPGFMAPEQARGEAATAASDLFALGRLVERCVEQPLATPVAGVVEKAVRQAPQERWHDASDMLRAWRDAQEAVARGR